MRLSHYLLVFTLKMNQGGGQVHGTQHVISQSDLPVKTEVKTEVKENMSDEAFSMEEIVNAKEFHKIASIKLNSCGETLDWYDNLALRGAMYGVSIPPRSSIASQSIVGTNWSKKLVGDTIHGRRSTMESHLYKLLVWNVLFATYCCKSHLGITNDACGDGYAAPHNILQLCHPRLHEQIVEVKYPSQTVIMRFGQYVKLVQQYTDLGSTCGHYYMRYEYLKVVLQSLHVNFRVALTKRVTGEFGVVRDKVHIIPIMVQVS
jgi:hypothetical protein